MNDNIIMSGIAHKFTDTEIADIISLFGEDPVIAIIEDGTCKDRSRAIRRKKTAAKHQHIDKIRTQYPIKVHKYGRKDLRSAKAWYKESDFRKDTKRQDLQDAWKIAAYLERRTKFFKAVDQWELINWLDGFDWIDDFGEEVRL